MESPRCAMVGWEVVYVAKDPPPSSFGSLSPLICVIIGGITEYQQHYSL